MNKKLLIIATIIASLTLTACNNEKTNEDVGDKVSEKQEDTVDKDIQENSEDEDMEKTTMTDEEMIDESDYIAKIKMIQKGQDKYELKVLENIKGNISSDSIPNKEFLEKNRAYLVFLKDVDGNVEVTNGNNSFILLEGDNHEIFEKINKQ